MKPFFILFLMLFLFSFEGRPSDLLLQKASVSRSLAPGDSLKFRFANNSSLKRLPSVIRDLKVALSQSIFQEEGFLNENGFDISLYDAVCKTFDTSATVTYRPNDAVFYLKLNRFNRQASDRALAVTLIHEVMHCILMDIDKRARYGDAKAFSIVEHFNLQIRNPFGYSGNNFFNLMNRGDVGEHELMYQLFYRDMVFLLERFAQIHKPAFWHHEDAELLIWSGLQTTSGFQKLSSDEKREIAFSILKEKGIPVSLLDY